MNDQELAAYNLKLAADTKEMVGNIILELFANYDFMRLLNEQCGWAMADRLSSSFVANPNFQTHLKNFLMQQLNKS